MSAIFRDLDVPETFNDSDAHVIKNSEEVRLKSFSTGIHKYAD